MKLILRIILSLSIISLIAGCKLAVIVVEGGEVMSTASGTCVASSICIVDVTDPNFSEAFTAVPDTGWFFQKWNAGDRFLCGDSTNPTCTLSFEGYEESKHVEDMVASSELFYLMPVFKRAKDNVVTVDGKQWLQPSAFVNLSYYDVLSICPTDGTPCHGSLNGISVTGYIWASFTDLHALAIPTYGMSNSTIFEADSEWAPAFFVDFIPTEYAPSHRSLTALTSGAYVYPERASAFLVYDEYAPADDDVYYYADTALDERSPNIGVFFYRPIP